MTSIDCILPLGQKLGESPVWSVEEQALYWVDSRAPTIHRLDPATGTQQMRRLPSLVGSIGLRRGGGLIVALQTGLYTLETLDGALTPVAQPETDLPENRFNDGRCDRQGRFWAGTMNDKRRDPTGALYRLDADHRCTKIRDDIIVPNSLAWSPDDRVMYLSDTYRSIILAYDFSPSDGRVSNPRTFFDTSAVPGRPDGSTIDAEGCLWNASYAGGRLVRYTPDGAIDRVLETPVSQPTSCCFGGPQLDVLYITSATQRLEPGQLAREPLAGGLFAAHVGVKGLPEPVYAG